MARLLLIVAIAAAVAFSVWRLMGDNTETPQLIVAAIVVADSEFDPCLECHDDLDASIEAGSVELIGFTHEEHFQNSGDVGCGNCHGLDIHDRTPPLVPTMNDCLSCHVAGGPAPALPCLRCHDTATVPPPQSHFAADWQSLHSSAAQLNQSLCETCHSKEAFCTACHGVEIPHDDGWAAIPHAQAAFDAGFDSCSRCHQRGSELSSRDYCDSCHHPESPDVSPWWVAHPEVVRDKGGTSCFECHDPDTCARCHTSGVEDFSADLKRLEIPVEESTDDE